MFTARPFLRKELNMAKLKKVSVGYVLMISHPSNLPKEVVDYLLSSLDNLVQDGRRTLDYIKDTFYSLFNTIFPWKQFHGNVYNIDDVVYHFVIKKASRISGLKSRRFMYELEFDLFINDVRIPMDFVEKLLQEYSCDMYDGFMLGIENGQYKVRIIEI